MSADQIEPDPPEAGDSYLYRTGFHHAMNQVRFVLKRAKTLDEAKQLASIYERVCRAHRHRRSELWYASHHGWQETLERFKSKDPYKDLPPRPDRDYP